MKQFSTKWKRFTAFGLALLLTFGATHLAGVGISTVEANNTPQPLPFTQDWTTNLITANDDWSPVPGIFGFLGNYVTASPTNVDPRTLIADFATNDVDVIANQTNPDTNSSGGVADFDGIANQTVALQGSGTADATTGPNLATLVTPVSVALPSAAGNQPLVQVRIVTTNAAGSDEWVGIDEINVTIAPRAAPNRANVDFNGDGRSDYAVTRNDSGSKVWFVNPAGSNGFTGAQFGISTDIEVPEDFDGDGKDDIAVWRAGTQAYFYVLRSSDNTFQFNPFGQTGDDPRVVADYDGDGKADYAVYRPSESGQGFFYYRASTSGGQMGMPFGGGLDLRPNVGDYDGDGRADFCLYINGGSGQGIFALLKSSDGAQEYVPFGSITDKLAPGDYDGDGKSDFAVVRSDGNALTWFVLTRTGAGFAVPFGAAADVIAPGDYDGDGKQDITVWRPGADASPSVFYSRRSSDNTLQAVAFGAATDYPAANWFVH